MLDQIQANYRNLVAPDREGDPVHLFHGDRDENFKFLADISETTMLCHHPNKVKNNHKNANRKRCVTESIHEN